MAPPVNPALFVLCKYPEEPRTMRDLIDWFKRVVSNAPRPATGTDRAYVDHCWDYLVSNLAERQGVPTSSLHYMLGELARTEMRLE